MNETILAIFLAAGFIKADPRLAWIPIDLTVMAASLVAMSVGWRLVTRRFAVPLAVLWIVVFFVVMAPSLLSTDWLPYPTEKVQRFFTLTFLASIAPAVLVRTESQLSRLLNAIAVIGAVMCLDAAVKVLAQPGGLARVSALGSNTIALGRGAGMTFLWVLVLIIHKRVRSATAAVLPVIALVAIGSGSRGPLLALGIAVMCLYFALKPQEIVRRLMVAATFGVIAVTAFIATRNLLPSASLVRIEQLLSGDLGDSESARIQAYRTAVDLIPRNPSGIGFGGFASKVNLWPGEDRQFPHNLLLEVLLENGWVAGTYLALLLTIALSRVLKQRIRLGATPGTDAIFAYLLFLLVNELFSGELNDSKMLFAFVAIALSFRNSETALEDRSPHVGAPAV